MQQQEPNAVTSRFVGGNSAAPGAKGWSSVCALGALAPVDVLSPDDPGVEGGERGRSRIGPQAVPSGAHAKTEREAEQSAMGRRPEILTLEIPEELIVTLSI